MEVIRAAAAEPRVEGAVAAISTLLRATIKEVSDKFEGRRSIEGGDGPITMVKLLECKNAADIAVVVHNDQVMIYSSWKMTSMPGVVPKRTKSGLFSLSDPELMSKVAGLFYEAFDMHYNPLKKRS